jgi:hypothetical protein
MGVGIYPVFDPKVPEAVFTCEGKVLARSYELLDEIADAKGLKTISSFGDNREIPEGFQGEPDELDEVLGPWDKWFKTQEGLITVEGVIDALQSDSNGTKDIERKNDLIAELEELARCLRLANIRKAKFRLEMG